MNIRPEPWLADIVTRLMPKQRKLAVDVGANTGEWTRSLAGEFSKVVAVEPDPRAYASIEENEVVSLVQAAVSGKTGGSVLHLRPKPDQNSLLETHPVGADGGSDAPVVDSVDVETVALDDLCPGGADLVKIDIEGAEVEALRGCSGSRWDRTLFVVECHDTLDSVRQELERLGKDVEVVPHPFPSHSGHCWAIGSPAE